MFIDYGRWYLQVNFKINLLHITAFLYFTSIKKTTKLPQYKETPIKISLFDIVYLMKVASNILFIRANKIILAFSGRGEGKLGGYFIWRLFRIKATLKRANLVFVLQQL